MENLSGFYIVKVILNYFRVRTFDFNEVMNRVISDVSHQLMTHDSESLS